MEGVGGNMNGLAQIERGFDGRTSTTEIVSSILGITLFAATMYASYIIIKTNKLTLRKLKDEGYY